MSRDLTEGVQIIEPPIEELTKKNSSLKKSCFGGCLTAIFFIALIIFGVKFYIGRGPHKINQLPKNYPMSIEIFDHYNLDNIQFISAKYKSRSLRLAGLFTKITVSPALISINTPSPDDQSDTLKAQALDLWNFMHVPIGDDTDTVKMEWKNVEATPESMITFYKNKLEKSNCVVTENSSAIETQMSFTDNHGTSGLIMIQKDINQKEKIPYAFMVVNFK